MDENPCNIYNKTFTQEYLNSEASIKGIPSSETNISPFLFRGMTLILLLITAVSFRPVA